MHSPYEKCNRNKLKEGENLQVTETIRKLQHRITHSRWESVQSVLIDFHLCPRDLFKIIEGYVGEPFGFETMHEWNYPLSCTRLKFVVCCDPNLPPTNTLIFILHKCKCSVHAFDLSGNLCTMLSDRCNADPKPALQHLTKVNQNLSIFYHGCLDKWILYDTFGLRSGQMVHSHDWVYKTIFTDDFYILKKAQHIEFYRRGDKVKIIDDQSTPYFCVNFRPYHCYALKVSEGKLFIFLQDKKDMWMTSFKLTDLQGEGRETTPASKSTCFRDVYTYQYKGSYTWMPIQFGFQCSLYIGDNKWLFGVKEAHEKKEEGLHLCDFETKETVKVYSKPVSCIERIGNVIVVLSLDTIVYLA